MDNKMSREEFIARHKAKMPFIIIALILFALYIGGLIAQLSSGNLLLGGADISFNPITCFKANFEIGIHGLLVVVVFYLVVAFCLFIKYKNGTLFQTEQDERGFKREKSGVYGTSKQLSIKDAKQFCEIDKLENISGMILGRQGNEIISIPPDGKRYKKNLMGGIVTQTNKITGEEEKVREKLKTNGNRHIMVTGASGSGKSYCFARPAIFQSILHGESIVVTDPKGELYGDTSEFAREHGYTVRIFNLSYPQGSDSWDALAELKTASQIGIEAQDFCSIIIDNTSNPNNNGDPVYSNSEKNLLTALVLYVLTAQHYTGPKTLGAVYELLQKTEDELENMFALLPEGSIALGPWNIFKTASQNMRGNTKLGLGVRIQVLQDEIIRNITGIPDIDLTQPGKSKCAYYIIMPDMKSTFRFISSLFFSCLFNKLVEFSRKQTPQVLPVKVNVILDEFTAIGTLPEFDKKLATVRSAGISIAMIFQTFAHLQAAYPGGLWETLLANCYTLLCLSCGDMTTAKYLSDRSGTMTTAVESTNINQPLTPFGGIADSVSKTYSVAQRAVLQPAEIIALSAENKVYISMLGADILIADKFPYTELVDETQLKKVNMYDHSPSWVMQQHRTADYRMEAEAASADAWAYQSTRNSRDGQATTQEPLSASSTDRARVETQEQFTTQSESPQIKIIQQTETDTDDDFSETEDYELSEEAPVEKKQPKHIKSRATNQDILEDF